ncbi:unnamed protein product [Bursaphelenchus xylophilus]|uniref:Peroxisomal ATPase PEX6 n=1 Tax=Bursaphelenchus xylophilus TaxID=6326 RepID=A0A1I7RS27_BURXY|nr:unnamed protein product [Bursaphelenchus xylophilus]CAG9123288.1 unnamed protein product [Bursaphelenchus xylophilus]
MYILKSALLQFLRSLSNGKVLIIKEKEFGGLDIDIHGTLFVDLKVYLVYRLYLNETFDINFVSDGKSFARSLRIRPIKSEGYYITSSLYYNIFHTNKISPVQVTKISKSKSEVERVDEILLGPIKQPDITIDENILDNYLVSYFRVNRILNSHDIIAVNVNIGTQKSTVYYKIFHGKSCFKVDSNTRLLQNHSISSRKPSSFLYDLRFVPSSMKNALSDPFRICDSIFDLESSTVTVNLLIGSIGSGQDLFLKLLANDLGVNLLKFNCFDLWNTEGKPTDSIVNGWFDKVKTFEPCLVQLENLHILGGNRNSDVNSSSRILEVLTQTIQNFSAKAVLFIPCTNIEMESFPKTFTKLIHFKFYISDLNSTDRNDFKEYLKRKKCEINEEKLLGEIRGMTLNELNQLVEEARIASLKENRPNITQKDFDWALELRNKAFGESVGVPKVPNVSWNDVGGLEDVKQLISESLNLNINHKRSNLRRSGVVLYGPPGCGKTLIAKAVANEFKMTFLSVKGPELLNQYIGQSEKNLRQVFERAKAAAPSIIFFDELDSLAPSRGVAGDSGGVMDRMVSQLLSELDDLQTQKDAPVFVMGATNRPDLLDPCLLSPGRFDKLIQVKLATDFESKVRILTPICKKVKMHEELTVEVVAELCPPSMSGAELSSVISKAAMVAVQERIQELENGQNPINEKPVQIHQAHIIHAIRSL